MSCLVIIFHILCFYIFNNHMFYMFMDHIFYIPMNMFNIMISVVTYIIYVIIIMLIYGIKMKLKLPKYVTFQKPNYRQFSVRGFAAVLKPDPFDGKNFLIWKAKMELWLT